MTIYICGDCELPAVWMRHTQFTGSHPFCDDHAREEDDFGKMDDDMVFWEAISERSDYKAREHHWEYCEHCQDRMVVCGKCGNNCCNGMHGEIWPGIECDGCSSAYEMQHKGEDS